MELAVNLTIILLPILVLFGIGRYLLKKYVPNDELAKKFGMTKEELENLYTKK